MATLPTVHVVEDGFVGVIKGESIRLYGSTVQYLRGGKTDVPYDVTFKVGDEAEYDSYNLSYTGTIVSIGAKTVTIATGDTGSRTRRLKLAEFSWRNQRFDAAETARKNAIEMQCI